MTRLLIALSFLAGCLAQTALSAAPFISVTQTASTSDPHFANVVFLAHMNGADGSTTVTDSSSSGKAVTAFGDAQIDTAQSKFGGGSALFDGVADYLSVASSADFNFGSDAFTVEFWVRFNTSDANRRCFFRTGVNGNIFITPSTGVVLVYRGVVCLQGGTTAFAANTWYHCAVTRWGNDYTFWRDGASYVTGTESNTFGTTAALLISNYISSEYLDGWLDDYRITKGVARYTAPFTPPTAEFPDQ